MHLPLPAVDSKNSDLGVSQLRERVTEHLLSQGFQVRNGKLITPVIEDKSRLRALHGESVREHRQRAAQSLGKHEDEFIAQLCPGNILDPEQIQPYLVEIVDKRSLDAKLWRWCTLHWSIPVSAGYGRRLRFLVRDRANRDAVVGLIGLADPVFSLAPRDAWIGWTSSDRNEHLTSVMDAYALGAVPPYAALRGGKLVSLLATTELVQSAFAIKYQYKQTLIRRENPQAHLALITTTSALGRSSMYNRLRTWDGQLAYIPVGYTSGTGDFHFSGAIYEELVDYARSITPPERTQRHPNWGSGFRNRREVIQKALYGLGFDGYAMRAHGIRREVYVAPLTADVRSYLKGETIWRPLSPSVEDVAGWWLHRWALPRYRNRSSSTEFDPNEWRLYSTG